MKLLVVLLVIVVIAVLVLAIRRLLRGGPPQWELVERADGELVSVLCAHGKEELLVGAVPFESTDFEYEIEELRARGAQKLIALGGTPGRPRRLGS